MNGKAKHITGWVSMEQSSLSSWSILASAHKKDGTHFVYPSIFQARFVLPLGKHQSRMGLSFFIPFRARILLYLKWLLHSFIFMNSRIIVVETEVMTEIKDLIGRRELKTIVKIGTPGPYAKDTVLFIESDDRPVAIGKIGTTNKAKCLLKNEAGWLEALSHNEELTDHCPRLVASRCTPTAHVIIQSVGAGEFSSHDLSPAHIHFLSALQKSSFGGKRYVGCVMQQEMERRFEALKSKLTSAWVTRSEYSLGLLERGLKDRPIPLVAAHRDFTPWNIRVTQKGIFVFDWEYASHGYLPLYDLFHFLLIPAALKNDISVSRLRALLRTVRTYGKMLDAGPCKLEAIEFQLLAYVTDLSLMYLESRDGRDSGFAILCRYGNVIDSFRTWGIQ